MSNRREKGNRRGKGRKVAEKRNGVATFLSKKGKGSDESKVKDVDMSLWSPTSVSAQETEANTVAQAECEHLVFKLKQNGRFQTLCERCSHRYATVGDKAVTAKVCALLSQEHGIKARYNRNKNKVCEHKCRACKHVCVGEYFVAKWAKQAADDFK